MKKFRQITVITSNLICVKWQLRAIADAVLMCTFNSNRTSYHHSLPIQKCLSSSSLCSLHAVAVQPENKNMCYAHRHERNVIKIDSVSRRSDVMKYPVARTSSQSSLNKQFSYYTHAVVRKKNKIYSEWKLWILLLLLFVDECLFVYLVGIWGGVWQTVRPYCLVHCVETEQAEDFSQAVNSSQTTRRAAICLRTVYDNKKKSCT